MKKTYYLLLIVFSISFLTVSQNEPQKLYQDLDKEIKAAKKAYYEQLKVEHDAKNLEAYTVRKDESDKKFTKHKQETLKSQHHTKRKRIKLQQEIADSRIVKKISLSEEIEQIKIYRKDFQEKEAEKRDEKESEIKRENKEKVENRIKKKENDYQSNQQVYKNKIGKRRQLLLERYSIK